MAFHEIKLTQKRYFELDSGIKNGQMIDFHTFIGSGYGVGDIMNFMMVDETGNPTPHQMYRRLTHIESFGGVDTESSVYMLSFGRMDDQEHSLYAACLSEDAAFSHWQNSLETVQSDSEVESARIAWGAALKWFKQTPSEMQAAAFDRAATIVRRGKQHNRGARGIDSHLEKAARRLEMRGDFERRFFAYVNGTPAKPQFVGHINDEDAKFLQGMRDRVGTFKMDLFLDADSAGAETKMLYILPPAISHQPLPLDCEIDRAAFESSFPDTKRYELGANGQYLDKDGLPLPSNPNGEWAGWKACYEHHVLPMSTEIARLKTEHRTEYLQAYWANERLGLGV